MADFNSPENLKALLRALEDTRESEIADSTLKNLVEKSPRRSSKAGDLFKMVGESVGESYDQGYKPNFTMGAEGADLPVKATGSGSKQLVSTGARELSKGTDDAIETTGKVLSKALVPVEASLEKSGGKELAKKLLKKGLSKGALGSLAVAGEVFGAEQVNPEDDTKNPVIADLLRENEIAKMSDDPEKQKLIAEFLNQSQYGMGQSPSEKLMQATKLKSQGKDVNASPEEFAKSITREADATQENVPPSPETQPDEVEQMAEAISTKPSDVVNKLKAEVSQQKQATPKEEVNMVAQLQKDLEDYKKLSESKIKDAKTLDMITNIGNRIQEAMSYFRQSNAAKGAGRMMERMTPTAQAEDALSKTLAENKSSYAQLKDKLAMAQAEQDKILGLKEKEKDRQLQRELASGKIAKEEAKEDKQIKKENRKMRTELNTAESSLTDQLKMLENAKKQFEDYSSGSLVGTGPLATGMGTKTFLSKDLESLESTFNNISLQNMVKMFAGMSKAVDSEAERRAFESTQPNIKLDDATNRKLLQDKIDATKSLLEKTRKSKNQYDRTGSFTAEEPTETTETQKEDKKSNVGPEGEFTERNGKKYRWNPSVNKYQLYGN